MKTLRYLIKKTEYPLSHSRYWINYFIGLENQVFQKEIPLRSFIFRVLICFVFNWRDCTVKTGSAMNLGQSPICHSPRSSAHWGYFRQFLTRLVQNLTLRNDCNLIPLAYRTQHLSSQSDYWTIRGFTSLSYLFKSSFQRGEVRVDDPQLSTGVVGFWWDLNLPLLTWESGALTSRPQGIDRFSWY